MASQSELGRVGGSVVSLTVNNCIYSVRWNKIPSQEALGNFELLIDEELAAQDESSGAAKGKSSNRWK